MSTRSLKAILEDFVPLNEQQRRCKFEIALELAERDTEIERQQVKIERLRAKRDSLTGWWVAEDCDDGSLILQSHTGERKRVWQGDH